ncbi:MAG: VCBS repeat-containing protein [Candidatus Zixiibacteriota bacterium]|nr:MAG: VCBS repeat-containing protein [candidate division Zixibacteria bacterium]
MRSILARLIVISALIMPLALRADPPQVGGVPVWTSAEQGVTGTGMAWADCNLDGQIDVFLANGNDITQSPNTIYLSERYWLPPQASWSSTNQEYSGQCAVGDINDDGFPDFVVANYLGNGFGDPNRSDLYLNTGYLPSRYPDWQTPDEIFSFSCALGDVDGDGDLDLAFATGEAYYADYQQDLLYINDGGSFGDSAAWRSDALTAAYDVYWGDIDNDGYLDLAVTYENSATAVFFNDSGTLETSPSWQASTVESGNTLMIGDINGDGWLDLITAYNNQLSGSGKFCVYFNDGAGMLETAPGWQSSTGGFGSALALWDYDNDGDDDLAAGRWFDPLRIYENQSGTLTPAPVWFSDVEIVAENLAWVDIDGRGVVAVTDTIAASDGRRLFYTSHHPLYAVDSVTVDGNPLDYPDYCYDLVSGWVSLGEAPSSEILIHYRYSFYNDLAVNNWDTVAMVFGNESQPSVDFAADITFGWAPLAVQFTCNEPDATSWRWQFGDGDSSSLQNPLHTYTDGGLFNVSLDVETSSGSLHGFEPGLILTLSDSISFAGKVTGPPGYVSIPITLKNTHPVLELFLPISYAGDLTMQYSSWTTVGCREDNFDDIDLISNNASERKLLMRLRSSSGVPVPPGRGTVLNVQFYQYGLGSAVVDTTRVIGYSVSADGSYVDYVPRISPGHVYHGTCGNVDGSSDGFVDISDLTVLISYLYISYDPPAYFDHANIDGSTDGVVDIGDLTHLIAYLFIDGPPPVCP